MCRSMVRRLGAGVAVQYAVTFRLAFSQLNRGGPPPSGRCVQPVNTRWNSWASPTAATPHRTARTSRSRSSTTWPSSMSLTVTGRVATTHLHHCQTDPTSLTPPDRRVTHQPDHPANPSAVRGAASLGLLGGCAAHHG